jgi:hypothetical protein
MKIFIIFLFAVNLFAQNNNHIIIDSSQAEQVRGKWGKYSAIEPVKTFDGKFIIPERVLTDPDLIQVRNILQTVKSNAVTQNIIDLPDAGVTVYLDSLYNSDDGLVKCRQTHVRTEHKPSQVPALFSFFRENSDTLSWIPNEEVKAGWKRIYEGVTYTCLQAHLTLSNWTPDVTPALWEAEQQQGNDCPDWVQPTGAHNAYQIGDCIKFNNKCYESTINANVWSPAVLPSGWNEVSCE